MLEHKNTKDDLLKRLRRIEGQVKGVQKMVESEKGCSDILIQVAAIRAAINKVGGIIFENHSEKCIKQALNKENSENAIHELVNNMLKLIK